MAHARVIRRNHKPRGVGTLESAVMDTLWRLGKASIGDIYTDVTADRPLAYTTVATVVTRLVGKKLVRRRRIAGADAYEASVSRHDLASAALDDVCGRLLNSSLAPLIDVLSRRRASATRDDVRALERIVKDLRRG